MAALKRPTAIESPTANAANPTLTDAQPTLSSDALDIAQTSNAVHKMQSELERRVLGRPVRSGGIQKIKHMAVNSFIIAGTLGAIGICAAVIGASKLVGRSEAGNFSVMYKSLMGASREVRNVISFTS